MDSTGIKGGEIGGVADIPLSEKSLEGEGMLDGRDFAGRQSQGVREVQEDSYGVVMASEFGGGVRDLFVLVADGMGGHAAGEVASGLAVKSFAGKLLEGGLGCDGARLWDGVEEANRRIAAEIKAKGKAVAGMGTTMLAMLVRGREVRWLSVGDSPLYRVSGGRIERLNRIHSRATALAEEVKAGRLTEAEARQDPSRHTLTSALIGEVIYEVDDPPAMGVEVGDVLVAATDGIETLTGGEIAEVVVGQANRGALEIAEALLAAVAAKKMPRQDNTTVVVVRISG